MQQFPGPAQPLIARMTEAALAAPEKAVAYQGAPGANSHIAALGAFPDCLPLPCFGFGDAIDAVREGRAELAMLPVENSTYGRGADIHTLLPESGLHIIDEAFVRVHINLLALPGTTLDQVTHAMSHTVLLGQCKSQIRDLGDVYAPWRVRRHFNSGGDFAL